MTKRQYLYLQRRSRPEQSDQRQANQPANIFHQPRASPDSTSLASRIAFPTMTGPVRSPTAPVLLMPISDALSQRELIWTACNRRKRLAVSNWMRDGGLL